MSTNESLWNYYWRHTCRCHIVNWSSFFSQFLDRDLLKKCTIAASLINFIFLLYSVPQKDTQNYMEIYECFSKPRGKTNWTLRFWIQNEEGKPQRFFFRNLLKQYSWGGFIQIWSWDHKLLIEIPTYLHVLQGTLFMSIKFLYFISAKSLVCSTQCASTFTDTFSRGIWRALKTFQSCIWYKEKTHSRVYTNANVSDHKTSIL